MLAAAWVLTALAVAAAVALVAAAAAFARRRAKRRSCLVPTALVDPCGLRERAAWAASPFWSGVVPDAWVFFCPNAPDQWPEALDLGAQNATPGRPIPESMCHVAACHPDQADSASPDGWSESG